MSSKIRIKDLTELIGQNVQFESDVIEKVVNEYLKKTAFYLKSEKMQAIPHIGTFKLRWHATHKSYNPKLKKEIDIPAGYNVRFHASNDLQEIIDQTLNSSLSEGDRLEASKSSEISNDFKETKNEFSGVSIPEDSDHSSEVESYSNNNSEENEAVLDTVKPENLDDLEKDIEKRYREMQESGSDTDISNLNEKFDGKLDKEEDIVALDESEIDSIVDAAKQAEKLETESLDIPDLNDIELESIQNIKPGTDVSSPKQQDDDQEMTLDADIGPIGIQESSLGNLSDETVINSFGASEGQELTLDSQDDQAGEVDENFDKEFDDIDENLPIEDIDEDIDISKEEEPIEFDDAPKDSDNKEELLNDINQNIHENVDPKVDEIIDKNIEKEIGEKLDKEVDEKINDKQHDDEPSSKEESIKPFEYVDESTVLSEDSPETNFTSNKDFQSGSPSGNTLNDKDEKAISDKTKIIALIGVCVMLIVLLVYINLPKTNEKSDILFSDNDGVLEDFSDEYDKEDDKEIVQTKNDDFREEDIAKGEFHETPQVKKQATKGLKKGKFIYLEWGDTLGKIAQKEYGNGKLWPFIYFDNEGTITSPTQLIPVKDHIIITHRTNGNLAELYYSLFIKYRNRKGFALEMLKAANQLDAKLIKNYSSDLSERELSVIR